MEARAAIPRTGAMKITALKTLAINTLMRNRVLVRVGTAQPGLYIEVDETADKHRFHKIILYPTTIRDADGAILDG